MFPAAQPPLSQTLIPSAQLHSEMATRFSNFANIEQVQTLVSMQNSWEMAAAHHWLSLIDFFQQYCGPDDQAYYLTQLQSLFQKLQTAPPFAIAGETLNVHFILRTLSDLMGLLHE